VWDVEWTGTATCRRTHVGHAEVVVEMTCVECREATRSREPGWCYRVTIGGVVRASGHRLASRAFAGVVAVNEAVRLGEEMRR
jgi:hypothetical protein